jgi:hypothetical protein
VAMNDPQTVGAVVAFLGTFAVAALMFFMHFIALCLLMALAGIGRLLAWIFTAISGGAGHEAGGAARPVTDAPVGRHYRSTAAKRRKFG